MIDVCLLGCGGVMPLPDRALTSLYVLSASGHGILIDCGEGTQMAIRYAKRKFSKIDAILFTHFHADHISGLPGLLLTLGIEGRTEPLIIHGPIGLSDTVTSLRTIAPDLPFEIIFVEHPTDECGRFSVFDMDLNVFPLKHSVPCLGYKVTLRRSPKFNADRARELNVPVEYWHVLQKGESVGGFDPCDVLGEPRRGISLLYATDTRPTPDIERYGKDTDLIILEGMFGEADKEERAKLTGHMMMKEAAETAARVGSRELWITHISPATPDPESYLDELRAIFKNTVLGKDRLSKALRFDD